MNSIRALLRRYDLEPLKGLGQHFLVAEGTLARIVSAAGLAADDTVLEIGAGLGNLTRELAAVAGQVVAVEIDQRLIPILNIELQTHSNVRIVEGNILDLEPSDLMKAKPYKVVANLPYSISSAVLRHLLEASHPPQYMVVMLQREVAERIVARDGRMSILAISVHLYGRPTHLLRVKPGAFFPPPEVDSAVIRIDPHQRPTVDIEDTELFFKVVRAGFSQPRKQLHNSLAGGLQLESQTVIAALQSIGLDHRLRAERLQLPDWEGVMRAIAPLIPQTNLSDAKGG